MASLKSPTGSQMPSRDRVPYRSESKHRILGDDLVLSVAKTADVSIETNITTRLPTMGRRVSEKMANGGRP
jgi:hypothetical protein